MTWLTETFLQWLACILVISPFVVIALWGKRQHSQPTLLTWSLTTLAAFFFISLALAHSSTAFNWIPSPWQGMFLEAIFALGVILFTNKVDTNGLQPVTSRRAWRDSMIASLLLCGYVIIRSIGLQLIGQREQSTPPNTEYLLYLLTIPGIAEELVYRGVLQSHLNNLFGKPWKILRTPLGWGWLITALLFWSIHAFQANGWSVNFYWPTLTLPLIAGLVFGWLRERSNSLLPPILAHNLINVIGALL